MLEHKSQIGPNEQKEIAYLKGLAQSLGGASRYQYAEWFTRVLFPA